MKQFTLLLQDRRTTYTTVATFQPIPRDRIASLSYGSVCYVQGQGVGESTAYPVRISGQAKLWKRDQRARIPWKYGLYEHGESTWNEHGVCQCPILSMVGESIEVHLGRKCEVTIKHASGSRVVNAHSPDGVFAIHEGTETWIYGVTHIASGLGVYEGRHSDAVLILHRIVASGHDFTRAETNKRVRAKLAKLIKRGK